MLLQHVLGPTIFGYPEAIKEHFMFPAGQAVYVFGITAVAVLLATTGGVERIGCWVEILSAVLVGVVLPLIQSVLSVSQNVLIGQGAGSFALVAYSSVVNLCSYATFLVPVATTLALLAAGMSISYKRMIKTME